MESRVSPLLRPYLSLLILIRDNEDGDCSVLNDMVKQVNNECLDQEDILADHAYYYSPDNGYIIVEDK